jgi:hypothetical protein
MAAHDMSEGNLAATEAKARVKLGLRGVPQWPSPVVQAGPLPAQPPAVVVAEQPANLARVAQAEKAVTIITGQPEHLRQHQLMVLVEAVVGEVPLMAPQAEPVQMDSFA